MSATADANADARAGNCVVSYSHSSSHPPLPSYSLSRASMSSVPAVFAASVVVFALFVVFFVVFSISSFCSFHPVASLVPFPFSG